METARAAKAAETAREAKVAEAVGVAKATETTEATKAKKAKETKGGGLGSGVGGGGHCYFFGVVQHHVSLQQSPTMASTSAWFLNHFWLQSTQIYFVFLPLIFYPTYERLFQ